MKIKYLGKNYKGLELELAVKFKVSTNAILNYNNNLYRYARNIITGDITKINISEKPLLLKPFVQRIKSDKLIRGGQIKKDVMITLDGIDLNKPITGMISADVFCFWESSGGKHTETVFIEVENKILHSEEDVAEMCYKKVQDLIIVVDMGVKSGEIKLSITRLEFITRNNVSLKFDNMKLRGVCLDITRIYGENVKLNKTDKDDCVKKYLLEIYKKISPNTINKLGDKNGISPLEIFNFCKEYGIKLILFNVEGEIRLQNHPEKKNKSYKNLIGICYNNHFYPLLNPVLHKIPRKEIKHCYFMTNLHNKLLEIINKNEYVSNIQLYQNEISSIQIDDTIYHNNKDYQYCNDILNQLGISNKMNFFTNKMNISSTIEELFLKNNYIDSFFPYQSYKFGYNYVNDGFIDDDKEIITIDHNKHYADALRNLQRLMTIDIKTAKHFMKPKYLLDDFLYIVKPKYSSILLPKTGFYSYDHLKYCKNEGLEFELLEAISCTYKVNYFKDMIDTLYKKLNPDDFKFIINCMIGRFEKKGDLKQILKFCKIANIDESKMTDKYIKKINHEYNIIYEQIDKPNTKIFNRVPIRIQVIDQANRTVYEKMKEEKLKQDDIKQIRTDAITYKTTKYFNSGDQMGEWKEQSTKFFDLSPVIEDIDITFKLNAINQNNTIYIDYAGSGKTYHIINNLIPTLDDFIVLSPAHASIKEYRQNDINCNVIQKYTLNHMLPQEDNIIIDEVGMLDSEMNNLIVKCALIGKKIYSFGDFKQLKPVKGEICNSDIYLNYIYNNICKLGTNYRNDFTFDYYEKLIAMTEYEDILEEIKKYNHENYYEAETIITYTNKTKDKYNNLMIERLGLKFGDVGCRIVCKKNDLKDFNIYNNFYYTIKDRDDDIIIITDGIDDIEIKEKQLNSNFELGYCRTLYNIQGESIKSFYFCLEDTPHIDGRALYTLISRLKKKI